jgi:glutathione-regulated potassium-efflux system ancillary protein KefC
VRVAVLAMPGENTNLLAMDRLRESGFTGRVVALARYADEVGHLRKAGVDEVFHLYGTAGVQLADYAADLALAERWLEPGAGRGRYPESEPGPQVPGERADTGAGRPTMDDGVT